MWSQPLGEARGEGVLQALAGRRHKAPAAAVKGKRKGGMSAAGRAAVAAAQKARWAKIRAEKAKAARGADR
jgi:hypothetical protein